MPTPTQPTARGNPSTRNLLAELNQAPKPDAEAMEAAADRAAHVLRPPGALQRLDDVAVWLAGWQAQPTPQIVRPQALLFAADHGVAAEGVSAFDPAITASMVSAIKKKQASITALAAVNSVPVEVLDVGVGQPSGNIRTEAALTPAELANAFNAGREAVRSHPSDLLVVGEMGIGNTTPAAALSAAICLPPAERTAANIAQFVGAGTGVDGEAYDHKVDVVVEAVARVGRESDPIVLLAELGGKELAAMAGAAWQARMSATPVLLDGYIASASVAALSQVDLTAVGHIWAGHRSEEKGHSALLALMEKEPLLELGLRLGEGSGAMLALPLVKMACALVNDVATFAEWEEAAAKETEAEPGLSNGLESP